jgi:hypothetical protein
VFTRQILILIAAILCYFSITASAAVKDSPFQMSVLNTKWFESPLPEGESNLVALFRSPTLHEGIQATLSVRIDSPNSARATDAHVRTPASLDLQKYSQHWMEDFPRFGFKVLKTETRTVNGDTAIVADLQDQSNGRRQRQMLRTNGSQVAILTCTDSKSTFTETAKTCEILMSTFRWANTSGRIEGLRHSPLTE